MNTKIIVNTKNLVAALEQVEKIFNTKSSDYLLRSAFIQAEDGKMKISANNLEVIGCKTIIPIYKKRCQEVDKEFNDLITLAEHICYDSDYTYFLKLLNISKR